jgi:hypothetical protein
MFVYLVLRKSTTTPRIARQIHLQKGVAQDQKLLAYTEYRAVFGVFRTIDPPPPLHPASVSFPLTKGGGGGG